MSDFQYGPSPENIHFIKETFLAQNGIGFILHQQGN